MADRTRAQAASSQGFLWNSVRSDAARRRYEFRFDQSNQSAFLERRAQWRRRRADHDHDDADDQQSQSDRYSQAPSTAKDNWMGSNFNYATCRRRHARESVVNSQWTLRVCNS